MKIHLPASWFLLVICILTLSFRKGPTGYFGVRIGNDFIWAGTINDSCGHSIYDPRTLAVYIETYEPDSIVRSLRNRFPDTYTKIEGIGYYFEACQK